MTCGGGPLQLVSASPGFRRLGWTAGFLGMVECPRAESCLSIQSDWGGTSLGNSSHLPQDHGFRILLEDSSSNANGSSHTRWSLRDELLRDQVHHAMPLAELPLPWSDEVCADGYAGTLCAQCAPGYSRWGSFECR